MRATAGQWVTESVELLSPIAEGAMGRVWVAYHHGLRTRVAVKFVSEKLAEETPEALARFRLEASAASQIKSPHVVQTFDSGLSQLGMPYIVMELLEGESLGDRLRRAGPLSVAEGAIVLHQVARALNRAHALGIVHRDIKPDNIFLTHNEEGLFCKVLDFGIAKQTQLPAMGGLTTDGKLVGTPEYMSPEQVLEDRPVDARADLWALAVVLYVSLAGRLPYEGRTLGQLCLNLVNRVPPPPTTVRPDLPPFVDHWFARALHRDPNRRFDSARQMAAAFRGEAESPLVDLGSITALTDITERNFGSVVAVPATKRWGTPLAATGVAASLGLLITAVVILGRAPEAPRVASAGLSAFVEEASFELPTRDEPVLDLDEAPATVEASPVKESSPMTKARPISRPAPTPKAASPPEKDPPSDRRGKAELGF